MKRCRFLYTCMGLAFALFLVHGSGTRVQAQIPPPPSISPSYGEPTAPELADFDWRHFNSFGVQVNVTVPLSDLQALLDTIEPGRFIAVPITVFFPEEDPTTGGIFLGASFERIFEFQTVNGPDLHGPVSELGIFAFVFDTLTPSPPLPGRLELTLLAAYTEDPNRINDVVGALVSREAEFRWQIDQKDRENRFKVKVKGVDGFSLKLKVKAPDALGFRQVSDPPQWAFRFLSDGPGGSHPAFASATQQDAILGFPDSAGVTPEGILKLPVGNLPIVDVIGGAIFRSVETFVQLE